MWKVVSPLVLSTGMLGCTARGALPLLSVRAMTVLHEGAATQAVDQRTHRFDFALSIQIAFNPGVRDRPRAAYTDRTFDTERTADIDREADTDAHFSAEPITCTDLALCAWADGAEQSILAAMGVLP
jgi:hypothetical protein